MSKTRVDLVGALVAVSCALGACGRADRRRDAGVFGEDPARRLTETECQAAIDHAIGLLHHAPDAEDLATQLTADRDARVADCVRTGTLRDFRCLMSSEDLAALGRCPMPGRATQTK